MLDFFSLSGCAEAVRAIPNIYPKKRMSKWTRYRNKAEKKSYG